MDRDRAGDVLRRIGSLAPGATYRIGDEQYGGEDPARALAVLDKLVAPTVPGPDALRRAWPMVRGDPARSARTSLHNDSYCASVYSSVSVPSSSMPTEKSLQRTRSR